MAIALWTNNSYKSQRVREELRRAIRNMESADGETSPIIPVVYEGARVPRTLSHIQYVDMTNSGAEDYLVKSVSRAMEKVVSRETA